MHCFSSNSAIIALIWSQIKWHFARPIYIFLGKAKMETISHNFYIINSIPRLAPHKVFENSFEYEIHIQIQIFAALAFPPGSPASWHPGSGFNEVLNHNLHKRLGDSPAAHHLPPKWPRPPQICIFRALIFTLFLCVLLSF